MEGKFVEEKRYLIVREGKPSKPYTLAELKLLQLKASDFVKEEGAEDFKEIRELPELSQLLAIDYQTAEPQYFATLDVRLLAWTIDFFLSFAIYCILVLVPIIGFTLPEQRVSFALIGLVSIIPIQFLVTLFMECSRYQGSPGKMVLRIKVCDMHGLPIKFPKSLVRNIGKILGFFSLGLGFFIGFLNRKQQCWHDKLANTLVIKDRLI